MSREALIGGALRVPDSPQQLVAIAVFLVVSATDRHAALGHGKLVRRAWGAV
ncbi:MAG: hypothetical protein ABI469_11595 [Gemmatimonadales bacterium]